MEYKNPKVPYEAYDDSQVQKVLLSEIVLIRKSLESDNAECFTSSEADMCEAAYRRGLEYVLEKAGLELSFVESLTELEELAGNLKSK